MILTQFPSLLAVLDGFFIVLFEQLDDEATLEDIVYTYTNPVEAGLVKWAGDWPGFTTYGWRFGEVRRFYRPKWFYDPNNADVPDYVDVKLERPQIFLELTDDELYELIMRRVRERSIELRARNRKAGLRRIKGLNKVQRQKWNEPPRTESAHFKRKPTVSARSKWTRIAALQRKQEWSLEYAEARRQTLAGGDPVYPYGTYWMPRFAGARVAAGP